MSGDKVKKSIRGILGALLALSATLVAAPAEAATFTWSSQPLTNLNPNGSLINGGFTNFPTKSGLYVSQCLAPAVSGERPTNCAQLLWVTPTATAGTPGMALPTGPISFTLKSSIKGNSGDIDCSVSQCGLFFRLDHLATTDKSEDTYLPITFASGAVTTPMLKTDELIITLNGAALKKNVPVNLSYRAKAVIASQSTSGLPVTITSATPECSYANGTLTALKGSGLCALSVSTAGNLEYEAARANYPFILALGKQSIGFSVTGAKKGTTRALPAVTNFGVSVVYKSKSKSCVIESNLITVGRGKSCVLTVKAAGKDLMWAPLDTTIKVNIK
jgi:hypothetical protein